MTKKRNPDENIKFHHLSVIKTDTTKLLQETLPDFCEEEERFLRRELSCDSIHINYDLTPCYQNDAVNGLSVAINAYKGDALVRRESFFVGEKAALLCENLDITRMLLAEACFGKRYRNLIEWACERREDDERHYPATLYQ